MVVLDRKVKQGEECSPRSAYFQSSFLSRSDDCCTRSASTSFIFPSSTTSRTYHSILRTPWSELYIGQVGNGRESRTEHVSRGWISRVLIQWYRREVLKSNVPEVGLRRAGRRRFKQVCSAQVTLADRGGSLVQIELIKQRSTNGGDRILLWRPKSGG